MTAHHSRDHAKWSASSTERSWNCPGSLALIASLDVPDTESEAAAWGTACHQVSEKCLTGGQDAIEFIGRIEKTKAHSFEVDEEMAECAQTYVDYVRDRAKGNKLLVEQKFSLASLNPPMEAGGTADAVVYAKEQKLLEVIDLKGGRGVVVEAEGNKQLRVYALGAVLASPGLDVDRVMVTIVQPRAPHKDGRIRSETFHVADLVEWTADLLAAMRKAKEAEAAFPAGSVAGYWETDEDTGRKFWQNTTAPSVAVWGAQHLSAGSWCKFCRATALCPAQAQKVIDAAALWFDDQDKPHIGNEPDTADPVKAAATLDMLDMIEEWVTAYRAYWHAKAEAGVEIPGYVLVERQGREKWKDEEAARGLLKDAPDNLWLNPGKIRTPKQVRDALKKAGLAVDLSGLSETPVTGTNLVRADKTSRPAATPKANQYYQPLS